MRVEFILLFHENCREAMEFYHHVFGGHLDIRYNRDGLASNGFPDLVGRAHLEVPGLSLTAQDFGAQHFDGFALQIDASDQAEQERLFHALAEGGNIVVPLGINPPGRRWGTVRDRFGVVWWL